MPIEDERWMTIAEVANYLQLSQAKIYEMAQNGQIPCTKVAGRWRFLRTEVDEWMIGQRSPKPKVDRSTDEVV